MADGPNQLLQTIRIPKNLMYLTDKLPHPSYDMDADSPTSKLPEISKEKLIKRRSFKKKVVPSKLAKFEDEEPNSDSNRKRIIHNIDKLYSLEKEQKEIESEKKKIVRIIRKKSKRKQYEEDSYNEPEKTIERAQYIANYNSLSPRKRKENLLREFEQNLPRVERKNYKKYMQSPYLHNVSNHKNRNKSHMDESNVSKNDALPSERSNKL